MYYVTRQLSSIRTRHKKILLLCFIILLTCYAWANLNSKGNSSDEMITENKTEINKSHKPPMDIDEQLMKKTAKEAQTEGQYEKTRIEDSLPFHPFENFCRFPIQSAYPQDIENRFEFSERIRKMTCNSTGTPMASLDDEGFLYIFPHFAIGNQSHFFQDIKCNITIFEGGLRTKIPGQDKNTIYDVVELEAPLNQRLHVNADAYYVKCFHSVNSTVFWRKPFPGMRDLEKPKNTVSIVSQIPNHNEYGRKIRRTAIRSRSNRLSIDILGIESTSRTMFQRQMPRTFEVMNRLGYEFFYGYNKVGDNSLVNLAPILAGDIKEAIEEPKLDESGDINENWILPTNRSIDPSTMKFLWNLMKEKFGCRTMLNEDISKRSYGLFNYPYPYKFLPGFTSSPADHYYRAYYLAVYENWSYRPCKDGDQIQKEFLGLWHRFATKYKDICHFGFTFITTLTHSTPIYISLIDEELANHLETQHSTGVLDKTASVILGDHGNRVSHISFTFSGRIEERMPLMAIRLPESFKKANPVAYSNFLNNRYKLTSNFDVHQMLKDIVLNDVNNRQDPGRGISLFKEISALRTCTDAYIAENFCTCLVDKSDLLQIVEGKEMLAKEAIQQHFFKAADKWISSNKLTSCITVDGPPYLEDHTTMSLNRYAREGYRSKANITVNEEFKAKHPYMDFFFHQIHIAANIVNSNEKLHLLWRFSNYLAKDEFQVNFDPFVENPPENCKFKSIVDICDCLNSSTP